MVASAERARCPIAMRSCANTANDSTPLVSSRSSLSRRSRTRCCSSSFRFERPRRHRVSATACMLCCGADSRQYGQHECKGITMLEYRHVLKSRSCIAGRAHPLGIRHSCSVQLSTFMHLSPNAGKPRTRPPAHLPLRCPKSKLDCPCSAPWPRWRKPGPRHSHLPEMYPMTRRATANGWSHGTQVPGRAAAKDL